MQTITHEVMSTVCYDGLCGRLAATTPGRGPAVTQIHAHGADGKKKDKDYEILINGTPFVVEDEVVTHEQVVALAFPDSAPGVGYSVVYRNARGGRGGSGTLPARGTVRVKQKGTSFYVTPTTRS